MVLYLRTRKVDISAGDDVELLMHNDDAKVIGINQGEIISFSWREATINAQVNLTSTEIQRGEIGLYEEVWKRWDIPNDENAVVSLLERSEAIEAIKKKILGKKLNEEELTMLMKHMGSRRISEAQVAFFMATFFNPGFDEDEVLWMTKGMGHSGDVLNFNNIRKNEDLVVDKHSIGGVAGKGVTPILVPIVAACDLVIPNTSTRAITSPAGTSDILEVVMPVSLDIDETVEVVRKTGGCMIWGGALDLAPADDVLIHAERGIHLESYQKVLVSIVAKKIATGVSHIVIDIPHGKGTKVQHPEDVEMLDKEFTKLFAKVGIKCDVYTRVSKGPDGRSIGPNLEMIETLKVLERTEDRSKSLEALVLDMTGRLLELSGKAKKDYGSEMAMEKLESKEALNKFWEIAKAQGAKKVTKSSDIEAGEYTKEFFAEDEGVVKMINNRELVKVARALGTPLIKRAGIYVHKMLGEDVKKGDKLITLYATTEARLESGEKEVDLGEMYELG